MVTVADSQGGFVVSLPGVNSCDSVTVTATGDEGSHAEFNLSQIACNTERREGRLAPALS